MPPPGRPPTMSRSISGTMLVSPVEKSLPIVLQAKMTTERSGCWSITINNPKEGEIETIELPAGWKLQGQMEVGKEGTPHYQGMLTTPQVRFSAVKKVLVRAHIEPARNRSALQKYVHKADTRSAEVDIVESRIPTLFDYQKVVADEWDEEEWHRFSKDVVPEKIDDIAMLYLDRIVAAHIEQGVKGIEFIAINPMWRSSWKKFWRSIIKRNAAQSQVQTPRSQDVEPSPKEGSGDS